MAELTRSESRTAVVVTRFVERRKAMAAVPIIDVQEAQRIYDGSILRWAVAGAAVCAALLGLLAYVLASGIWPIAGFGQFAAAGIAPALFTGAGVGAAVGALVGALWALYRLPARAVR